MNLHNKNWDYLDIKFDKEVGLKDKEIEKSIELYGSNFITEKKKTHPLLKFLEEFTNLFSILLQIGSILCFLGYGLDTDMTDFLYLGIVLYVVVFLTAIFSFYQESKSESIMNSFKNLLPQKAKVIRNNHFLQIDSKNLVVGDTIILEIGDKVNADIRLFESNDMKVDNSILTGESEPQSRKIDLYDDNILESKNIVFFGTTVIEGSGKGIVIKIGDNTEMGKIANLAQGTVKIDTPIKKEIKYFVKIISSIAIFLGIVFFILGIIKKTSYIINIINCIGIIVANVPEGLLATVTIILSLAAKQMANKNVLVKNLETVESLGSTSVICTDKTGTLTQNKLTVSNIIYNGKIFPHHQYPELTPKNKYNWDTFLSIGIRCNCSREIVNNGISKNIGNPTDVAIKNWICNKLTLSSNYETLLEIPFDSKKKFHLKIIKTGDNVEYFLKGAYDTIIHFCPKTFQDDKISETNTIKLNNLVNKLASEGERILGFAYKLTKYQEDKDYYHSNNLDELLKNIIFYGMLSFSDPPRKNVPWAVTECQNAGIKVVMVTGDHPITAISIGKKVGIIQSDKKDIGVIDDIIKLGKITNDRPGYVIVGKVIPHLTDKEWKLLLEKNELVFARTSPEQKLLIVEKFQEKGEVVAVTGDGVNDSPALKKADIGIAMGINGSDVSKETADMVLLDDNFASIVKGVKEGRRVFENLKKSIAYTLSSNIPEICPFLFFIIINIPLPLTTVLILFIDLGTDMIPAISFAWENTESDLMLQKPRKLGIDRLVDFNLINFSYLQIGILQAVAAFFTYFYVMDMEGLPFYLLPGLGDHFGEKDLFCNKNLDKCGFTEKTDYNLYKTKEDCQRILETAQTSYFVTIIIVQIADKIICKTRRLSIFQHCSFHWGDFFGISSELILGLLITYLPFLNTGLSTRQLRWEYWLISIPFALYIFFYDEMRRLLLRKINKNSLIHKVLKW